MTTYPYGYGSQRLTMDELEQKNTIKHCHPEFWRRLRALLIAGNGAVGVGTAWRSATLQDDERARRRRLGTGAPMAPSNKSWHCAGAAADLVGDLSWARGARSRVRVAQLRGRERRTVAFPTGRPVPACAAGGREPVAVFGVITADVGGPRPGGTGCGR